MKVSAVIPVNVTAARNPATFVTVTFCPGVLTAAFGGRLRILEHIVVTDPTPAAPQFVIDGDKFEGGAAVRQVVVAHAGTADALWGRTNSLRHGDASSRTQSASPPACQVDVPTIFGKDSPTI